MIARGDVDMESLDRIKNQLPAQVREAENQLKRINANDNEEAARKINQHMLMPTVNLQKKQTVNPVDIQEALI